MNKRVPITVMKGPNRVIIGESEITPEGTIVVSTVWDAEYGRILQGNDFKHYSVNYDQETLLAELVPNPPEPRPVAVGFNFQGPNHRAIRKVTDSVTRCKLCNEVIGPEEPQFKCCPKHTTERGNDVVCGKCRDILHSEEVERRNVFDQMKPEPRNIQ